MANLIVYLILLAIAASLGLALFSLLKAKSDNADRTKIVKALTIRIGLSIFLFVFLIICFLMGWIKPHGINPVAEYNLQPINKNK
jgi:uncharacterized protein YacL